MCENLKILKRQQGISVVEALVSVSLTLVVALSISQVSTQLIKTSRKMSFFEDAEKLTKEIQTLLSNQQTCIKQFTDSSASLLSYDDTLTDLVISGTSVKFCPVDFGSSYIDINNSSSTNLDCSSSDKIYQGEFVQGKAKISEIKIKHEKFTGLSDRNLNDPNDPIRRFSRLNVATIKVTLVDTENPSFSVVKTFPINLETDPTTFEVLNCYSGSTANLQAGLGDQACSSYQTVFNDPLMDPPIENYIINYGYDPDTNDCRMVNPPPNRPPRPQAPPTHGYLACDGSTEDIATCPTETSWVDHCHFVLPADTWPPGFDLGDGFGGNSDLADCEVDPNGGHFASCNWAAPPALPAGSVNICQVVCVVPLTVIDAVKQGNPNCVDH